LKDRSDDKELELNEDCKHCVQEKSPDESTEISEINLLRRRIVEREEGEEFPDTIPQSTSLSTRRIDVHENILSDE